MTPKEKAEELVDKFMKTKSHKISDYSIIYSPTAKLYALIAVDEVLEYSKKHGFIGLTEWYQQVKQELEKI